MKKILSFILAAAILCMTVSLAYASETEKARLIITQDGEVDDQNSMIHLLLYADVIDIAGLIQTSSSLHYAGHDDVEPYRWVGTAWMDAVLDAYEAVYPNLSVHSDYPTPEYIRSITKIGNITDNGEMEQITEGSELIKSCILDDDPRPLYIGIGGGANTFGRALKSIEEEYAASAEWETLKERISNKIIMVSCGNQDNVYATYISVNWPNIRNYAFGAGGAYGYTNAAAAVPLIAQKRMQGSWMYENLLHNHGPLMDLYFSWGDGKSVEGEPWSNQFGVNEDMLGTKNWFGGKYAGAVNYRYDFLSEGDSADWMLLIPTGLRSLEDMSWGGWGGRYLPAVPTMGRGETVAPNPNAAYFSEPAGETVLAHFLYAIQGDFAARVSWCTAENYADANHQPIVAVEEDLNQTAKPGDIVTLHITAADPDGDAVQITAWQYEEVSSCSSKAAISLEDSVATVVIPEDAHAGDTIHLIVEAADQGEHFLRHYARVVVTVE